MPWMIPVAMAVAGAAKGALAADSAANQRKAQAEVTRYSPWTHMQGQSVQDPSIIGDTLQGGAAGIGLMQGMNAAKTPDLSGVNKDYLSSADPSSLKGGSGLSLGLNGASPTPMSNGLSFNNSPTASMYSGMADTGNPQSMPGSAGALTGASMSQMMGRKKSPYDLLNMFSQNSSS